jgi:putative transposase
MKRVGHWNNGYIVGNRSLQQVPEFFKLAEQAWQQAGRQGKPSLVVGWAMSASNDEELVTLALEMALLRRSPPREMLLHSDQGSTSTSTGYLARLAASGIVVSMSRTGDCYDNAAMESFFSTLKGECMDRQAFETRQEARLVIFEYIECFYNRERRHSTLQYLSPAAYEQQMS